MPRLPRSALSKRALRKSKPRYQLNPNADPHVSTPAQLKKAQRRIVDLTSVHKGRLVKFRYPIEMGRLMSARGARFLIAPCMRCLCRRPVAHYQVPGTGEWGGKNIAVCPKGKANGCGFFVCFDTIRNRGPLVIKTNDYSLLPGGVHAEDDVMVQDGLIHYDPTGRFAHVEMSDADADGDDDPDYQAPAPASEPAEPVTPPSNPEVIDLTKARDCKFCKGIKVPGVHHACKAVNKGVIDIDECPDCDVCGFVEIPDEVHVCYIRD
ncbi:hypothetical protein PM082_000370 [Marasmius tenuissimus]|nr:hypothetical protein PM082_000370 [Marasmius tenuissimus]